MLLRELDGNVRPSVVILQTSSSRLEMYIQDKMKLKYHVHQEAMIDIQTKQNYKEVRDVIGVLPPFAERWLVLVNLDRNSDKDLMRLISQSTTCCFVCTVHKYSIYKRVKQELKEVNGVFDFYINYLRRADLLYLYDAFVSEDNRLTKNLFDFVAQGYSGDIDSIFELLIAINNGQKFTTRKDITDLLGAGGLTIESYIFQLLKPLSGSDTGLTSVVRNRVKVGYDLGQLFSWRTMYDMLSSSLGYLIEIKMLILSGDVYKDIRNLPDSYNEKRLAKYQKYIWRLKELTMSELLRLRVSLGSKVWDSDADFVNFIYKYYGEKGALLCQ